MSVVIYRTRHFFESGLITLLMAHMAFTAFVCYGNVATSTGSETTAESIPFDRLGAAVDRQVNPAWNAVEPRDNGALIRCVMQRLEGEVSERGFVLRSTVEPNTGDELSLRAALIGRTGKNQAPTLLPNTGVVTVENGVARWARDGLIEEFRASSDGIRQDFVVLHAPEGEGQLLVELDLAGALATSNPDGVDLKMLPSGRKLAYHRLHVTDATGRELNARLKARNESTLSIFVADDNAVYPVRIDPTFSDATWFSVGGLPGANGVVHAIAADEVSGRVYFGGEFDTIRNVQANHVAVWNGTTWSNLGEGVDSHVFALTVDNAGNLYAGGQFTTAGDIPANFIAKWNGSEWTNLV